MKTVRVAAGIIQRDNEVLACLLYTSTDPIALALAMFEACGIYAVSPTNERMALSLIHI